VRIDARSIVRAWRLARAAGRELFTPGVGETLASLPGWGGCGMPSSGVTSDPAVTALEALRAVELHHLEQPADLARVALVATLPGGPRPVAATRDVVREILRGARRELLVLGFSITDTEFCALLTKRAVEGVRVTVVGDREARDVEALARGWPTTATPLTALRDVQPDRGEHRRMHGKVIVADRRVALLGSANFSAGGLSGNIEFGVRVEGGVAQEIHRAVEALREEGWLVAARV